MSKLGAVRLVIINKAGLLLVLPASLRLGARAHAAPSPSGAPSFTPQTLPFVFSPLTPLKVNPAQRHRDLWRSVALKALPLGSHREGRRFQGPALPAVI